MTKPLHLILGAVLLVLACAEGTSPEDTQRQVRDVQVEFSQNVVVRSSVLRFRFLDTSDRQATVGTVRFSGSLGEGRAIDEKFLVPVDRVGDRGDLVVELPVAGRLWDLVEPDPSRTLSGHIDLSLEDEIGVFAAGEVEAVALRFHAEYAPRVTPIQSGRNVFPNQHLKISGDGFLRPEEGKTWAVVDEGAMHFGDGTSRQATNARVAVIWTGARDEAVLPISPSIFGVQVGSFRGSLRFENELETGEVFAGTTQDEFAANLRRPRIDGLSPDEGSRGQKITVSGRGFVHEDVRNNSGTYLVLAGRLTPSDRGRNPINFRDESELVISPYRVVDEATLEQDVAYTVESEFRAISGLGAVPGVFEGTITPWVYHATEEQEGEPWTGRFTVLPTRQVVYVKFLSGFSRALGQYGLAPVEVDIRNRILSVLRRDYAEANVEFVIDPPVDFVTYTTIEIGGPDPSGLLNFGYDNSFNEGGKDIGNLYLNDYLGGVNRHSADAGYLPYGGVFIESFIAFSPRLFPDSFGTAPDFDRVLSPFMPALGGSPITTDEWPDGSRDAAIHNAISMMGNLTGHTASHEIGHSVGLAYFPSTVEDYAERFHNDPPGKNLIMDSGADRPFEERAEINGEGPARFSDDNLEYLRIVLPRTP